LLVQRSFTELSNRKFCGILYTRLVSIHFCVVHIPLALGISKVPDDANTEILFRVEEMVDTTCTTAYASGTLYTCMCTSICATMYATKCATVNSSKINMCYLEE